MLKITRLTSRGVLFALGLGACWLGMAAVASAQPCDPTLAGSSGCLPTSDRPAGLLVWPKILVDTTGVSGPVTDTIIQLTNTASTPTAARCFLVNANSHCAPPAAAGTVCQTSHDCPVGTTGFAACLPDWNEFDFDVVLTANQPLGWHASTGLSRADLPLRGNTGTGVPPVPELPFVGALTCIQIASVTSPSIDVTSNSLKGEGTIERVLTGGIPDVEIYNAIGLLGSGTPPVTDGVLQLGGTQADGSTAPFGPCPSTLILNHTFDTFVIPTAETTDLTLVPCGNDFLRQQPGVVTAQFIVFNEFEQRFSTSRTVDCFLETQLSLLDTTDPTRSIFSQRVAGTTLGQTRIKGVGTASTGRGLLGIARRIERVSGRGAAYNLFESGVPDFAGGAPVDVITIP